MPEDDNEDGCKALRATPEALAMFRKERGEHPGKEFSNEMIWQIVEDHLHGENARKFYSQPNTFKMLTPLIKSATAPGEYFGGIASTSDLDRDGDIITEKALANAADMLNGTTVFFNHDWNGLGVGVVKRAWFEAGQVRIEVKATKAEGMRDVLTQIEEGVLKSFSIGARVLKHENEWREDLQKNVRRITELALFEASVVGMPANANASITSYVSKALGAPGGDIIETNEAAPAGAAGPDVTKCNKGKEKGDEDEKKEKGEMKSFDPEELEKRLNATIEKKFDAMKTAVEAGLVEAVKAMKPAETPDPAPVKKGLAVEAQVTPSEVDMTMKGLAEVSPREQDFVKRLSGGYAVKGAR